MNSSSSLTRTAKAQGILASGDIHESRPGIWRVRATVTGSGRWHIVTATSCSCTDWNRTGLACKHLISKNEYEKRAQAIETGPRCPDCGSATKAQQYYCGGTYRWFADCTRNPEHQAVRL